jgi:type VI secretion system secreted protein VgrG
MDLTQENRAMNIDTPLGKDVLLLTELKGIEGISAPFRYDLDLISGESDIEFAKIVGKSVTVSIELADGGKRLIHGIITYFSKADAGVTEPNAKRYYPYRATLLPAFWLLSLTGDCKIFQNLTALEIVERIFKEHKIIYKNNTNESYSKREYCVQYNESDFTFVSRLLEGEGIFYYFKHEKNLHTIVLVDKNEQIPPCPDQEIVKYCLNLTSTAEEDTITSLECDLHIGPTGFAIEDFNFKTPNTDLEVNAPALHKYSKMDLELYCYPGDYESKKGGMRLVDMRMGEEEAHGAEITGSSGCRALQSGYHFELRQFYREAMNSKKYLVTSVRHRVSQSFEEGGQFHYANTFSCIPHTIKYRPLRTTQKPLVQGSQTAIVTGPKGDEIYTDEHGRVKVQFHWDREGKKDENSSCWIRVAQVWAGANWGAMYIPRIGHEVIVDFLEGDPDRPIITGRVYHGMNKPPYLLPGEKTKSTIKSNSSLGGGGFNEFRFEDKKGNEEIFLHGQKDWTIAILNDKNQTVGHDETLDVGNNRTKSVKKDQSETIGENKTISVGKNHTESIGENANVDITKNETFSVGENSSVTIGKNFTKDIGEKSDTTVGKSMTIAVGKDSSTQVSENMMVDVGKKLSIQAGEQITIQTGDASITMKKDGTITISGKDITVKGSGKININADGNVGIKGSKITQN